VDVAVVGGGPAGLAAGMTLARAAISHLVLERGEPGGLLRSAGLVENYPGFPGGIGARELVARTVEQARGLGVRLLPVEVLRVSLAGEQFTLESSRGRLQARALILATGSLPRSEMELLDGVDLDRVHRETCTLPAQLAGQQVWISGAGDAAYDSALQLVGRGARVALASRGPVPRAMRLLAQRAAQAGIPVHLGWCLRGVRASADGLRLSFSLASGESRSLQTHHLLICHGRSPADGLWRQLAGERAPLPGAVASGIPGLYLAGDLLWGRCRYAGVAVGDGIRAATLAERQLERYRARSSDPGPGSS